MSTFFVNLKLKKKNFWLDIKIIYKHWAINKISLGISWDELGFFAVLVDLGVHGLVFLVFQYKNINFSGTFSLFVDDFEVKLLDEFFPISIGEIPSFQQVVTPLDFLPVMKFNDTGQTLVHQDDLSILLAYPIF